MRQILCGSLALVFYLGVASQSQSAHIYFSEFNGGRIGRANLDGTGRITLVSGIANPAGPTLDLARGQMYWGEAGGANISRANLDGTGRTNLVSGRNGPGAPALDLAGGRMFWNDSGGGDIRRANLDGSGQQVLVTGLNDPHTVVLDLAGGKIYWTDFGGGNVRRANLDGSGLQTLLQGLATPALIAIDIAGGKMYFTGQGSGDIRRANLDGSGQEILVRNQNAPAGIALDLGNSHIYWSNAGGGDIRRANLDGSDPRILITGLSGPAVITLEVDSGPPSIHSQPQSQFVPLAGAAAFSVAAAGWKPLFYQWQFNGVPLTGETNAALPFLSPNASDTGDYTVTVSNSLGVVTSALARLVVASSPIILSEPLSRTIVESNATNFAVSAIGVAPLNYQWRFNGTNISSATATNLALTNVQVSQAGEYSVLVSNSYGVVTSAVAVLTVLVKPQIVLHPQNQTVLEGRTVTFVAAASGSSPLSFRWIRNGVPFTNAIFINTVTTSSLTLTNVGMTNHGAVFRTVVTNLAGAAPSSTSARLSVLADFDRDGMADEWEAHYGFNTNSVADATLDTDADGMSNRDEYLAGTDPIAAQSFLEISSIASGAGGLSLQFFAVSNRTYSVLFAPSLPVAVWEKMLDVGSQPSNRLETVTDPAAPTSQRFYRVVTPKWP